MKRSLQIIRKQRISPEKPIISPPTAPKTVEANVNEVASTIFYIFSPIFLLSPKFDATSPELIKKNPRPEGRQIEEKGVETSVEIKPRASPLAKTQPVGDVNSPAPVSGNASEKSSKEAVYGTPFVDMPVTLSNSPSPVGSRGNTKEKPKIDT